MEGYLRYKKGRSKKWEKDKYWFKLENGILNRYSGYDVIMQEAFQFKSSISIIGMAINKEDPYDKRNATAFSILKEDGEIAWILDTQDANNTKSKYKINTKLKVLTFSLCSQNG
jgi:hypothetical protein